ncbi:hypothetical protein OG749_38165 [Streptomyces nojiriensis]|uniref:hypothetical protein n=1 Tax=Streptomyces nojiriensis TaxID=66374 RepID=UPI002E178B7C
MTLSAEGRETADYYKVIQSGELGTGCALTLARQLLGRRCRPPFFAEVWKPGAAPREQPHLTRGLSWAS